MYDLAKKARAGMKSKAERLAGEKDRKTDSSDWSPAEPLNADVKTGMRPVSRRAYKKGGKVLGEVSKQRADRKARKAGGRVEEKKGEQPLVDRYINRDLKKANEYRDGKKHVGGMNKGGKVSKKEPSKKAESSKKYVNKYMTEDGYTFYEHPDGRISDSLKRSEEDMSWDNKRDFMSAVEGSVKNIGKPEETYKNGGRAKKQAGGEMSADQHIREIIKSDAKNAAMDDFVKRKMFENKEGKIPVPQERPKNLNPPPKKVKPNWKYYITGDTITSAPKEIGKKNGGAANHPDVKEDKALIKKMVKSSAMKDDRKKRADGGKIDVDAMIAKAEEIDRKRQKVLDDMKEKHPDKTYWQGVIAEMNKRFSPEYFADLKKQRKEGLNKDEDYKKFEERRAKKANGGPMMMDPRLGIVKNKAMEFGENVVTPGLKSGGRAKKASGGSAEFKAAFRAARNAFVKGEGPKNFEFKGKSYSTDLYKPTTGPATRGGTSGAPRKPVLVKNIDVQFGAPDSGMPKTDQMGNPNPGMKKGGRIAKQIGGALGKVAGALSRGMPNAQAPAMGRPGMGGGMNRPVPMGGKRPMMGMEQPMQMGAGFPGGPPIGSNPALGGGRLVPPNQGQVPITTMPTNPIYGGRPGDMMATTDQGLMRSMQPMPMGGSQQIRQYAPFQEGFDPSKLGSTEGLNADQVAQIRASQPGGMNVPPSRGPNGEFMATTDQGLMSGMRGQMSPEMSAYYAADAQAQAGKTAALLDRMGQMPRKSGGRVARAMGGPTVSESKSKGKSGKTNINIVIATGKQQPQSMVPEAPNAPMGIPPMPAPSAPPAAPMGAPPVQSAPMLGGAGGPPPMPPTGGGMPPMPPDDMMPPMGRKAGGRVTKVAKSYKDMEAGAGSGEGRLQKTDIAKRIPKPAFEKGVNAYEGRGYPNKVLGATGGRTARKEGGKVYRSYKDMDAGAGSGKGRLEKTEIQTRKK